MNSAYKIRIQHTRIVLKLNVRKTKWLRLGTNEGDEDMFNKRRSIIWIDLLTWTEKSVKIMDTVKM